MIKNSLFGIISVLLITLAGCKTKSDMNHPKHKELIVEEFETSNEPDYQLVDALKNQLLKSGIDTVIYYQRTSIGCCDFYYLLWQKESRTFLHKVFYDQEKQGRRSVRIEINDEAIFDLLHTTYTDLKKNKIKDNTHLLEKEGDVITTSPVIISSHYRYSEINIYSKNDSIFSARMKDKDFNMFTGSEDENGTPFTNDNYDENISSGWNLLLTAIENKVLSQNVTGQTEKAIARKLAN